MKKIKIIINLLLAYGISNSYAADNGVTDRSACADGSVAGCTGLPEQCKNANACLGNQKDCQQEISRVISDNFRNLDDEYKKYVIKNDIFSKFLPGYYILLQLGLQNTITNGKLTDIDQKSNAQNLAIVNDLLSGNNKSQPTMWFVLKALATTAFANFAHNPKSNLDANNPVTFDKASQKVTFKAFPMGQGNDFLNIYQRTAGVVGMDSSKFGLDGKNTKSGLNEKQAYSTFTDCQIPFGDENKYYTYPVCQGSPDTTAINCGSKKTVPENTYGLFAEVNLLIDESDDYDDFKLIYNTKMNLDPTDSKSEMVQIYYKYDDVYYAKPQPDKTLQACFSPKGVRLGDNLEKCKVPADQKDLYICPSDQQSLQNGSKEVPSFCKYENVKAPTGKLYAADPSFLWTNDEGKPDKNGQNAPAGSGCFKGNFEDKTFALKFNQLDSYPSCNSVYNPTICSLLNNGNGPSSSTNQRLNWPGNFYFLNDLYFPLSSEIKNLQSTSADASFKTEFEDAVNRLVADKDPYDSSKVNIPDNDLDNQIIKKTLEKGDLESFKKIIAQANRGEYFKNESTSALDAYKLFIEDIIKNLPSFKEWLIDLLKKAATYNVMAHDLNQAFLDYAVGILNQNEKANNPNSPSTYSAEMSWKDVPLFNMPAGFTSDLDKIISEPVISAVTQRTNDDSTPDSASNPMYRYYLNKGYELNNAKIPVAFYKILKNNQAQIVNCPDVNRHRNVSWSYCNFATEKNQIACKRNYYDAHDGLLTVFLPYGGMLNWIKMKKQKDSKEANSMACTISALSKKAFDANNKWEGQGNACNTVAQDAFGLISLISSLGFAFVAVLGPRDLLKSVLGEERWESIFNIFKKNNKADSEEEGNLNSAEESVKDEETARAEIEEARAQEEIRNDSQGASEQLENLRDLNNATTGEREISQGHSSELEARGTEVEARLTERAEFEFE
jgi:hypothetical protein